MACQYLHRDFVKVFHKCFCFIVLLSHHNIPGGFFINHIVNVANEDQRHSLQRGVGAAGGLVQGQLDHECGQNQ